MTNSQTVHIDYDDPAERVEGCPKCGNETLWTDADLGQQFCVACHYYHEETDDE